MGFLFIIIQIKYFVYTFPCLLFCLCVYVTSSVCCPVFYCVCVCVIPFVCCPVSLSIPCYRNPLIPSDLAFFKKKLSVTMCMCVWTYAQCFGKTGGGMSDPLQLCMSRCELPHGWWEPNSDPRQKQMALLNH